MSKADEERARALARDIGLYSWMGSCQVFDKDKLTTIAAALAAVREDCAKVAENAFPYAATDSEMARLHLCQEIAQAIRTAPSRPSEGEG